ncbi:MAG: ABC transporter substrate-binding protein [Lachnospiraceae bacterium]
MKRKSVALILAFAMLAGLLGGCGNDGSSVGSDQTTQVEEGNQLTESDSYGTTEAIDTSEKEPIEMSVLWWGSQLRNERTQQILDMYAEENSYITFDGQFSDDYFTRLATLAAGQAMPDVVQMVYAYLPQYAGENTLIDLTPYIEDGTIDVSNVAESVLATGEIDGGIYGICNGINSLALLYNNTLLEEAGITINDYMTVEEFKNVCRDVYEKTGYKTSLSYGSNENQQFMQFIVRSQGQHLYGVDGMFGVESADAFLPFFQLYEDGIKEGWQLDPSLYVERVRGQVQEDPMVYGSSPENMSWCGFYSSNQLASMQAAAPEGTDIGITTYPSDDAKKSLWLNPSQFFSISTNSENPEEAAGLINYITNSIECNNVLLGERGVPISSVVAETIAENQSADDQEVVSYINNVVTPNSSTIDAPLPSASSEVMSLLDSITEKVLYGQLTAQEAADQYYEQGNAILAE